MKTGELAIWLSERKSFQAEAKALKGWETPGVLGVSKEASITREELTSRKSEARGIQ